MRKISRQTASHTPHMSKHSSNELACQPEPQAKIDKDTPTGKREQRLVAYLVIMLAIIWTITALITQNFFLLSGLPLLARELSYSLRRVIDVLLPLEKLP